jgi:hypothetical protein
MVLETRGLERKLAYLTGRLKKLADWFPPKQKGLSMQKD